MKTRIIITIEGNQLSVAGFPTDPVICMEILAAVMKAMAAKIHESRERVIQSVTPEQAMRVLK